MKKILTLYIMLFLAVGVACAQNARDLIRLGNREYRAKQYPKAETYYRKSIAKQPTFEAYYNLGNTMVMQQKDSTAHECYLKADSIGTSDPLRRARNFHNMGNIWYAQGLAAASQDDKEHAASAFQSAVNNYKSSLRCNHADDETRYNLAMAQFMLKKFQNNSNGGGGSDDKNKDKNEQEKKQKEEEQKKQQEQQQNQQQPPQKKDEMSDQTAEQLLNSAQQDEKDVQRKVNQQQNNSKRNLEKDW